MTLSRDMSAHVVTALKFSLPILTCRICNSYCAPDVAFLPAADTANSFWLSNLQRSQQGPVEEYAVALLWRTKLQEYTSAQRVTGTISVLPGTLGRMSPSQLDWLPSC